MIELMFDRSVVLGIDPGVTRFGYGVVERVAAGGRGTRGGLSARAAGVIRTDRHQPLPERLRIIADEVDALIAEYQPTAVSVERVLFQVNVRSAMATGQASGLALVAAARAGIPVVHFSPNEVKAAVAGHGGADKSEVQKMVQALLGLAEAPDPPDAADALALALCLHAQAGLVGAVGAAPIADPATTGRLAAAIAAAEARDRTALA